MSTNQIKIMIESIVNADCGATDRQNWVAMQVARFHGSFGADRADAEGNLLEYAVAAKATSKEVYAVYVAELSKVSKVIHEDLNVIGSYCETNDKWAGLKADLKDNKIVFAATRATKKVILVELAKLIVKAGTEANVAEAEAILAELVKRYELTDKAVGE